MLVAQSFPNAVLMLMPSEVVCGEATLRTSPSSGQAPHQLSAAPPKAPSCHSGAAVGAGGTSPLVRNREAGARPPCSPLVSQAQRTDNQRLNRPFPVLSAAAPTPLLLRWQGLLAGTPAGSLGRHLPAIAGVVLCVLLAGLPWITRGGLSLLIAACGLLWVEIGRAHV